VSGAFYQFKIIMVKSILIYVWEGDCLGPGTTPAIFFKKINVRKYI